jgi:hypothetical protein
MILCNHSFYASLSGGSIVSDEFERTWKGAVVADFKVISKHLPAETEENNETPESEKKPDKIRIRSGTATILRH